VLTVSETKYAATLLVILFCRFRIKITHKNLGYDKIKQDFCDKNSPVNGRKYKFKFLCRTTSTHLAKVNKPAFAFKD